MKAFITIFGILSISSTVFAADSNLGSTKEKALSECNCILTEQDPSSVNFDTIHNISNTREKLEALEGELVGTYSIEVNAEKAQRANLSAQNIIVTLKKEISRTTEIRDISNPNTGYFRFAFTAKKKNVDVKELFKIADELTKASGEIVMWQLELVDVHQHVIYY